jgi:homoserine kinase type II
VADAGRGTRGLKPTITPAVVDAVQRTWDLNLDRAVALGGSTGLNFLVDARHGRLVVRVHRAHITAARVHALQAAREAAALGGVPTARTILGRHGERYACADSWVIEVEEFIDSDAKMDTLPRIRQAMPLLARLHAALDRVNLPDAADDLRFGNYLAAVEVAAKNAAGVQRVRGLHSSLHPIADMADAVAAQLAATPASTDPLPDQWCHGDYWDTNVLFRNGHIVLVADFGFMNRRPRIDDLALTLYFTLWELDTAGHPNPAAELAALVDAYDPGAQRPLADDERSALPLALARQSLWSIGVWAVELDDDAAVIAHLQGHDAALTRALDILEHIDQWHSAFQRTPGS